MLGKYFTAGLTYRAESGWVQVKSRGPVITRGVERPIVRLTVDDNGTVRRAKVYANRDYETRSVTKPSPARHEWILPSVTQLRPAHEYLALANGTSPGNSSSAHSNLAQQYPSAPTKPRRRKARPAALSGHSASPVRVSRPRSASSTRSINPQNFPAVVPPPENEYCEEACYWLPPNTHHVTAGQYTILDALSELLWVDAPAAIWRDGELVEHDAPIGLTSSELTAAVHQVEQPTPRQVRALERTIKHLIQRRLIERTGANYYRLRGWECLHTRRRTTRRAIEVGGGRAWYSYVRFSA